MTKTRKNRKGISIYHFIDSNIGDGFNPLIFNHFIGNKHPVYKHIDSLPVFSEKPHIIGIGSIIKWGKEVDASKQIIVGSGFISEQHVPYAHQPLKIISVRGPKTRAKYLEYGLKCPAIYGDLGLLTRYVIPPPITCNKKFKIGFIPHYYDKKTPLILKVKENPDWTVINIRQAYTPKRFVKQIHECEYILSSSLHGIIISDSYGIPAYHIELSDKIIGGQWKFKDYYESVKRPYGTIDITSMDEDKILKQLKPYKLDFDFDGYYQYIKEELNKVA
jgi:pyruvyltransferase